MQREKRGPDLLSFYQAALNREFQVSTRWKRAWRFRKPRSGLAGAVNRHGGLRPAALAKKNGTLQPTGMRARSDIVPLDR
jgi:hypothetical protein